MNKLSIVLAGAVGYVLGARAGKERYAAMKSKATEVWRNPKVQETKSHAAHLVKEKAPVVQEKVADAASKATATGMRVAGRKGETSSHDDPSADATPATVFGDTTAADIDHGDSGAQS